jgi:hypothetical protein
VIRRLLSLLASKERWSLSCDFHNWTIHDLSENEARVLIETLRSSEKATLLVWKTGWPSWRSLRDPECAVLLQTRIVQIEAPPVSQQASFDPEITSVHLKPTATAPISTRRHNRFDVEFPVTVVMGTQEFHTVCVDLSEGGMRLRDPLPEWVAGYTSVILHIDQDRSIEVMCSLAEDQKHSKTRLEIAISEKQPEFLDWFRSQPQFRA